MKHDANSIVREHGVAQLRRVFDQAPMFEASPTSADAGRDILPTPPDDRARFVPVAIDDVLVPHVPAWLIDGLLPARGLACIVGPPKSGKSS
jgi:hypothetical protein